MKKIWITLIISVLVLLFGMAGVSAQSNAYNTYFCSSVELVPVNDNSVEVRCYPLDATPTPTEVSTDTPTPEPTFTPTIEPTVTPTSTGTIEPFASAPLCLNHDSTLYHDLWDEVNGCHYNHTHGDNPHDVDDIFGTEVYSLMAGEISYPWHTPGENEEIKHKSYTWFVARDLPCFNQYGPGCITAFRAFGHTDLHNVVSTHHSALIEAIVCLKPEDGGNENSCGRFLVSGHQATGDLMINQTQVLDRVEPANSPRPVMLHGDAPGARDNATWYGTFYGWMRLATQTGDMWGYYPLPSVPLPTTPDQLNFVRRNGNASRQQPHVVSVGIPPQIISQGTFDSDGDGILNYNGFINVHTGLLDCTEITEMCSPLIIENIPAKAFTTVRPGYSGTQYRGIEFREFDIFFGGQSSNWLEFPGFVQ